MSESERRAGARGGDTRERILAAASAELARTGFAGARMESIAQLAGVKKQVIYYYFPSKAELAREVLEKANANTSGFWDSFSSSTLTEIAHAAVKIASVAEEPIAHLVWEGREYANPQGLVIPLGQQRAADLRRIVGVIAAEQAAGRLSSSIAPEYLGLLVTFLTMAPATLPQLTALITGLDRRDPAFVQEWARTIDHVLTALGSPD